MNAKVISRRGFMKGTALAAGAFALGQLPNVQAANRPWADDGPDMRFGFTTYTWGRDWDIATIIANCTKAGAMGVELRTSSNYAHGVELTISAARRAEVKKRFADSPITLVGLATSERYDSPDEATLRKAIENTKAFLQLSHDIGASGVRVFPNDFHKGEPQAATLARIARALNILGPVAGALGQEIRLENHGSAGEMVNLARIMAQVSDPNVKLKLNCDPRDMKGQGLEHNFNLVKPWLGHTIHVHDFNDKAFDHQLFINLLAKSNYKGWLLIENSSKVEDRVTALAEQRQVFERMLAIARKAV
ncbi:MAG TPA: sugar phosphate isomerase/epimerase family protein [Anaerohalosphaeraceae bacterium]|mgnify:CR=1 FL=1|jgi:sugar phosphate isomerase/epimerase|nr:sugar phosphate isomerase/epimerase family protein [Anaerohalosphaeraceae bacterium]HRT51873.1 sugar phosphate isomerase/epimerase family protein [Anaerohalosphaeraceae bacterium]HRT87911.1 sugar phosphate isomerase/epimerase family protein [Anaerohalosphaeraceae bacterium]